MTQDVRPFFLAGRAQATAQTAEVRNPYDGTLVATVALAGPDEYEAATRACVAAAPVVGGPPRTTSRSTWSPTRSRPPSPRATRWS